MLLVWVSVGGRFACFGWLFPVVADFVLFLSLNWMLPSGLVGGWVLRATRLVVWWGVEC